MVSRSTTILLAMTGVCLGAIGIVLLSLGVTGYLTYLEPCVTLVSFEIVDVQLVSDKDSSSSSSSNPMGSLLDAFQQVTGIAVPTRLNTTVEFAIQVNNTNAYAISYEQDTQADQSIAIVRGNDQVIPLGRWTMDPGQMQARSGAEIPISVHASLDYMDEMSQILSGDITFRMRGTVIGHGWFPGVGGHLTLDCTATMNGGMVVNGDLRSLSCVQTSHLAGGIIQESVNISGEDAVQDLFVEEDDTTCYV